MLMALILFFAVVGVIAVVDIAALTIAGKIAKDERDETLERPELLDIHEEE